MTDRYLVVNKANIIENVVVWDGVAEWSPPPDCRAIKFDGPSSSGWTWDGTQAIDPNAPAPSVAPPAGTGPNVIA